MTSLREYVWKPRFHLIYASPYISGLYLTLLQISVFLKLLLLICVASCYADFPQTSPTLLLLCSFFSRNLSSNACPLNVGILHCSTWSTQAISSTVMVSPTNYDSNFHIYFSNPDLRPESHISTVLFLLFQNIDQELLMTCQCYSQPSYFLLTLILTLRRRNQIVAFIALSLDLTWLWAQLVMMHLSANIRTK